MDDSFIIKVLEKAGEYNKYAFIAFPRKVRKFILFRIFLKFTLTGKIFENKPPVLANTRTRRILPNFIGCPELPVYKK